VNDGLRFASLISAKNTKASGAIPIIEAAQAVSYRRQPAKAAQTRTQLYASVVSIG
jgi:hypothetical protein